MKLRGLVPNFYIHVSVIDLYVPTDRSVNAIQQNRQTDRGNIKNCSSHIYMNVEIRNEAMQFHI
jgi:hypothetical protein